jgi:hypothetical protein
MMERDLSPEAVVDGQVKHAITMAGHLEAGADSLREEAGKYWAMAQ